MLTRSRDYRMQGKPLARRPVGTNGRRTSGHLEDVHDHGGGARIRQALRLPLANSP